MQIYLAHPIDQVRINAWAATLGNMVVGVQTAILDQGHTAFQPGRAYALSVGKVPSSADLAYIDRINQQALWESQALIAILAPGIPTLGTVAEIEMALTLNRPTLIVTTVGLADSSVQVGQWIRRGAQVRFTRDDGTWKGQAPNLAEALGSLPDPSKLVTPEFSTTDPLLVKRTSDQAKVPGRAYRGDAGLDLAVIGEHELRPYEYQLLPTGIKAAIPPGFWGFMTGRSSAWSQHRIEVRTAVIDSGYRGELMVGVTWNPPVGQAGPASNKLIEPGTRLAQYVLLPSFMGDVVEVDDLGGSERGERGYGSSGH